MHAVTTILWPSWKKTTLCPSGLSSQTPFEEFFNGRPRSFGISLPGVNLTYHRIIANIFFFSDFGIFALDS
jgi:hypothetical protein